MNALQLFNYRDNQVRVNLIDNEPWFVAKDVCDILGIRQYRDAIAKLDDDERASVIVDTLGGPQEMSTVNEPGVYSLTFRSRKAEAKHFRRWVTHEILPSIRKTGQYSTSQLNPKFTPRMALDVAKFVSRELKSNSTPNPITLNILQEVFAQSGINVPLEEYRKRAEELKQAEEERMALSKKLRLQPGTIPAGPNRIKELREARGWAQRDLAHKAGVSRVLISHTERAKKNVSQNAWEGICKAFEMPLEEVFPRYLADKLS